ncbi:hypothetical protein, partial [Eisenbergiella tayi]|uniref:hypothetical protein n=1 Tax=Eisenbergiella tayi TaxID=1432052 RepID=UPI003C6D0EB0
MMKNRAGKLIGILLLVMGLFLAAGCGSEAGESETQETEAQQERVTKHYGQEHKRQTEKRAADN